MTTASAFYAAPVMTFDTLSANLRAEFGVGTAPAAAMSGVVEQLRRFGNSGLQAHVRACLQDEATLQAIAARSHMHGNGFYKIVLEDDPAFRLRMHIWPAGFHAQENLHSHRWYFASTVLCGQLQSEIWEDAATPGEQAYDEYLYLGLAAGKQPYDLPVGKARVALREHVVHRAGDAYTMPPHVLHRIVASGQSMTSTLTCHSAIAKSWARTISISGAKPDIEQRFLSVAALRQAFAGYLQEAAACTTAD